ncbi:MAG: PIG-L family deacetylase [Lentisphaerota bacterium]
MKILRQRFLFLTAGLVLLACATSLSFFPKAPDRPNAPPFLALEPGDRLMILAPHEDDETLGPGGVIQQALSTGAQVRVVFLTCGDHYEWAFMAFEKKLWITPTENRAMGYLRQRESTDAMSLLGLDAGNLAFLGFPDMGTLPIWESHWGSSPAFHSLLIKASAVPYTNTLAFGQPFKGENIVRDLKKLMADYKPTRILVSHPGDGHPDHRSWYLYLQVALLDLKGQIPDPDVYCYVVHAGTWPVPTGYHPEQWLSIPDRLTDSPGLWFMAELDPRQVGMKQRAILLYKSETAVNEAWLLGFARRNELFMKPETVVLTNEESRIKDFARASAETVAYQNNSQTGNLHSIRYAGTDEGLVLTIELHSFLEQIFGIFVHVYGYRPDIDFAGMPKLNIFWAPKELYVADQDRQLSPNVLSAERSGKILTLAIPWETLNQPDAIFVEAHGMAGKLRVSQTSWRLLLRKAPDATEP